MTLPPEVLARLEAANRPANHVSMTCDGTLYTKVRVSDLQAALSTISTQAARIAELEGALLETLVAYEAFMNDVDWGKSFLQASTIRAANEVPGRARVALTGGNTP